MASRKPVWGVVEKCHFRDMEMYRSVTRRQASLDAPETLHHVMIREERRETGKEQGDVGENATSSVGVTHFE